MDKKKIAAAIAAVVAYINTREPAAGCVPEVSGPDPVLAEEPRLQQIAQQTNLWGISGRQAHMQTNSMMQLRMFK